MSSQLIDAHKTKAIDSINNIYTIHHYTHTHTHTHTHTNTRTHLPPDATPILRNTGIPPKGSKASNAPDTNALHAVSPNRDRGPENRVRIFVRIE